MIELNILDDENFNWLVEQSDKKQAYKLENIDLLDQEPSSLISEAKEKEIYNVVSIRHETYSIKEQTYYGFFRLFGNFVLYSELKARLSYSYSGLYIVSISAPYYFLSIYFNLKGSYITYTYNFVYPKIILHNPPPPEFKSIDLKIPSLYILSALSKIANAIFKYREIFVSRCFKILKL